MNVSTIKRGRRGNHEHKDVHRARSATIRADSLAVITSLCLECGRIYHVQVYDSDLSTVEGGHAHSHGWCEHCEPPLTGGI